MPHISSDLVHRIDALGEHHTAVLAFLVVGLLRLKQSMALFAVLFLSASYSVNGEAQVQNFPEMDLPTLATRAESAFEANPGEAIPYMLEIRTRLTMAMSEEYRSIYRENIYMLGLAHMKWFQQTQDAVPLKDGIPFWNEFIQEFLDDKRHPLAMLNLGDSYYGIEDYNEAIRVYRHVLEIYSQQLGSEELLGVLQRLTFASETSERTSEMQALLWQFIGDAYAYEVRIYCLNTLFDTALESTDLDDLLRLVVEINEGAFRYDLGVNLRLLNAGDRFEEEERYLEAGLLFSMVLPVEQLLYRVEDRLIRIEERLFLRQYIASKRSGLERQLLELRSQRSELVQAPKYTANLRWRQARVLRLMGRTFEAFFAFRRLIDEYPQHVHIEQFRYAAFLQGIECGYVEEAILIGAAYLDVPAYVLFEKPIAVQLARIYEKNKYIDKLSELADEFLHRFPYEPVASQMTHSLGHAWFVAGKTEAILENFPYWVEEFPDGAFVDSVYYWSGMAYLFTGDFENALIAFDRLIESNPGSVYYQEARFRRCVANFGMGEYGLARQIFTEWVGENSKHPLQAEAHVFLGDLDAMEAEIESALANYAKVETLGGSQALIDHAYFESASLLLANKRYEAHDDLLTQYLERFPESPSAPEALLRLAEADLDQGLIGSAFERYRDGIERFGNSIDADHVDQLIDAWWKTDTEVRQRAIQSSAFVEQLLGDEAFRSEILYNRVAQIRYFQEHSAIPEVIQSALTIRQPLYEALIEDTNKTDILDSGKSLALEDYEILDLAMRQIKAQQKQLPPVQPKEAFLAMRATALEEEQAALALRLLRVLNLRAGVEVSPVELGEAEVVIASPATLVWIAKIEAQVDPLTARMLLRQVIERAPTGMTAAEALFLLAGLEMDTAFFDEAADYYQRILDDYFGYERVAQAAVLRGDALRMAHRYEDAIEAYSIIIAQREWRGEIWAEATYKIGLCFLQLNQVDKAQGFFERTYLAYGGYPAWSGKAVLESGTLLEDQGDRESAKRTYEFFLNAPNSNESPLCEVVRQRFQTL